MRNHIANTTHTSGPKESIIANAHDNNMIQYLKYEISRLENKFMLTQSQLNVEKARAEQLKEVMLESENNVANLSSGVGWAKEANSEIEPFEHWTWSSRKKCLEERKRVLAENFRWNQRNHMCLWAK